MPTNLTGRFVLIFAVLLGALLIVFPYAVYAPNGESHFTPNIRPGIDMVGGSSLLYQIKSDEGTRPAPDLAERVISALRQRVDPDGVKNLVWRAQGADKIEIQLPTTTEGTNARPARKNFAEAQQAIDALDIHRPQVEAALALPADQRQAAFDALTKGSTRRAEAFKKLMAAQATLDAVAGKDAAAESSARLTIDTELDSLPQLNVELGELDRAVTAAKAEDRDKAIAELRGRDPIFATPVDQFVKTWGEFQKVKDAVGDVAELKRLLKGSGVLSFHICAKPEEAGRENIERMVERLAKDGPRYRAGDDMAWILNDRPGEHGRSTTTRVYNGAEYMLVWMTPENSLRNVEGMQKWALTSAYQTRGQNGEPLVAFSFDPVGAGRFGDMTGKHRPESPGGPYDLAAVLDNKVISNASLQAQISAHGTISGGGKGGFSNEELNYLTRTLSAGSLPAQLEEEPQVERTVGPQLGADNLKAGFIACGFGVAVVAVFLVTYYYLAGVVALFAMAINLVLILAGMSALGATFTLPGVAGIILTIGMAVDANVLIFERLREEQHRGLSLRVALRNAYDRAFTAILDSNVTAGITGVILYVIGTEDVKGFGLTLLLGILSSLFTSLFVTKTIFALLINRFHIEKLSSIPITFPAWERFLHPKIDWIGKKWIFIGFSTIFIAIGFTVLVQKFREGRVLDIEFAGGTIVQFNLRDPMPQEDVRHLVEEHAKAAPGTIDAPAIQSIGDIVKTADGRPGYKSYEVVTVTSDVNSVRTALGEAMSGKLDVAQSATFDGSGITDLAKVPPGLIVPITSATQNVGGFVPRSIGEHVGGVAVIVRNMNPRLESPVADVRNRMDQQRANAGGSFKKYSVEPLPDNSGVVVLASDPDVVYDENNIDAIQAWNASVATTTWERVNDAILHPAEFSRISKINESVAGETGTNAIIALITSIVLIVIYVWIRFGDLKYGGATVVALGHDVVFMVASLGIAHLLADTSVGRALLLQPFRINLTMVSAILAIIGFSMSDTVVIFDRIRENRNKAGHLDRALINASINQTLGRTLLMGVTTLATLFVMYLTGGEAIHGFTFALFFGLMTGVYSSVAIASPLLLLGDPKAPALSGEVVDRNIVAA